MYAKSAHERLHACTGMIRAENRMKPTTPPTLACAVCGRRWDDVEDAQEAYAYQYSTNQAKEWTCSACYVMRVAAPETLGIERFARGKPDNPVYAKLGMLPGSGGLLTVDNELHLALPQGFIDKFQKYGLGRAGGLHRMSSLDLLLTLMAKRRLGAIEDGIVFIETFGRKADMLAANLQITRDLSELWCCSETGSYCLDLASMIESAYWLNDHGFADKATKPAFWKPIRDAAQGRRDDAALKKWTKGFGEHSPQALLDRLPIDPYARTQLPRLMKAIMPWVKEGAL